ncbi:MAG: DNA (cytosine-5-)-methyltransferase [Candidatus Aminicenantes bacterium]|jgi:DNA (cytosine-5)-methyltransferase 1
MSKLTHGSCFSGIGGFEIAARWAGIETNWSIEVDEYCREILNLHFKKTKKYKNIMEVNLNELEPVDIISGGFPCQPFSYAGKRRGKADDRYLWPKMLEIIRIVKPSFVLGENVYGIINMALDQTLIDLEDSGYTCETFCIPACALNAPHRRDRVWIIAYTSCQYGDTTKFQTKVSNKEIEKAIRHWKNIRFIHRGVNKVEFWKADESLLCRNADGLPYELDRLKALGNTIVPQIAYLFFEAIKVLNNGKERDF